MKTTGKKECRPSGASIDLAHEMGVQVVIVHPGRVDIDTKLETALSDLYTKGKIRHG